MFAAGALSLHLFRESLSMFLISVTMSGVGLLGPSGFPDATAALEDDDLLPLEEDPLLSFGNGFPHQSVPFRSHSA